MTDTLYSSPPSLQQVYAVNSHGGVQKVKNARTESKFVDRDKKFNAEAMNVQITLAENLEPWPET